MSRLEETLEKDGWELTKVTDLKSGDYIAVPGGYSGATEGEVDHVVDNGNGTSTVFFGELGLEVFQTGTGAVWVAPKEYEHLETRWDSNGHKYINISNVPRRPYFCRAKDIHQDHIFIPMNRHKILSACKDPGNLLKEKP